MRKTLAAVIVVILLISAAPVQASAYWFSPEVPHESPQFTSPGFWDNPVFENPYTPPERDDEPSPAPIEDQDPVIENILRTGLNYWGTPYEFGSDRNNTRTFDCSDFVRHIFKESSGVTLPADSRKQGAYVRDLGEKVNRISDLQRGDLMFFMKDKGDYVGITKSKQRITHVGIYLGDGKILHTYSKDSGGVRINQVTGTEWEQRFLFGGSGLE